MAEKSPKKITFARMGTITIPLKAVLEEMGATLVLPPENNKKTLDLGVKYSMEGICLPYKLNLGNYIQALDAGADTIVMFQAPGSCRFGSYTKTSARVLRDMGYKFEVVLFDMYKDQMKGVIEKFTYVAGSSNIFKLFRGFRLGFTKFYYIDDIERKLFYTRPREIKHGQAEIVYKRGLKLIDEAKTIKELNDAKKKTMEAFDNIETDKEKYVPIVYLTGEFFVLLDPYTNMNIEKELGLLGVEVQRQIMFSDWLEHVLKPGFLYKKESHRKRSLRYAKEFIKRPIGGECLESIGDIVYAARHNVDGVIHLTPFNCTPETIAQNILPTVSEKEKIPVISLILDEFTARAGYLTRVEAFVDLIKRRKRLKLNFNKRKLNNKLN